MAKTAIVALVALSLALHLFRIGYPARPAFDEAHFATYAGDYATGKPFIDIHPPLGKWIFAAVLSFYPRERLAGAEFVKILRAPDGSLTATEDRGAYGDYPYVALRLVSTLFGVALPVALYFFMRSVGVSEIGAALGALFVVLDNALLLTTRLILLDGMLLVFAFAALGVYFRAPRFAAAGGALFGLALAVKLSAIVFLGPPAAAYLIARTAAERKAELSRLARFALVGFAVLACIIFLGTFSFSVADRLQILNFVGFWGGHSLPWSPEWQATHPVRMYIAATVGEILFSVGNYIVGNGHEGASPWYFWPAGHERVVYYSPPAGESGGSVVLLGNLIAWLAASLAIAAAIAAFLRYHREHRGGQDERRPFFPIFGGYLACLLPFVLVVHRSTFLYHYLPALTFAYAFLGWFVARGLKLDHWSRLTQRKALVLGVIACIAVLGFLAVAPYTYGL